MGVRLTKPFAPLTEEAVHALPGQLGVFELADDDAAVQLIGFAGGREPFGIRSALAAHIGRHPMFRWECTPAYLTRWQELLMVYRADHDGALPPDQGDPGMPIGRLSPL